MNTDLNESNENSKICLSLLSLAVFFCGGHIYLRNSADVEVNMNLLHSGCTAP